MMRWWRPPVNEKPLEIEVIEIRLKHC